MLFTQAKKLISIFTLYFNLSEIWVLVYIGSFLAQLIVLHQKKKKINVPFWSNEKFQS